MPVPAAGGVLLVDKPGGVTSHDVVARARRALGTRKVGHAGTLDPMATGLLVLGVDSATRLLTYLVGLGKTYEATVRLGVATDSDDADGSVTAEADASELTREEIERHTAAFRGEILQVPSTVSAIKVNGRRAYDLAREGEEVALKERRVSVSRFEIGDIRVAGRHLDLDVVVDCSSGTYVRALARDLGRSLGVGGHLTALRRTRIGDFDVADAAAPQDIAPELLVMPATVAVAVLGAFPVSDEEATALWQGKRLHGAAGRLGAGRAAIAPGGALVGVVEARGDDVKSAMNLPAPAGPATKETSP